MAWGGRRPGSGRKPKRRVQSARGPVEIARVAAHVFEHPGAGPAVGTAEPLAPPADLSGQEREWWLLLAPHAVEAGTLTPATVVAFRLLIENLGVLKDLATDATSRGSADHRGMLGRVDTELLAFNLAPVGKPMAVLPSAPTVVPVNPLEKFMRRA